MWSNPFEELRGRQFQNGGKYVLISPEFDFETTLGRQIEGCASQCPAAVPHSNTIGFQVFSQKTTDRIWVSGRWTFVSRFFWCSIRYILPIAAWYFNTSLAILFWRNLKLGASVIFISALDALNSKAIWCCQFRFSDNYRQLAGLKGNKKYVSCLFVKS